MPYNPGAFSDFEISKLASISNLQTAAAGGGQNALGVVITAAITRFTTVATTNDSVTLPPAESVKGQRFIVINSGAQTLAVFPAKSETINAIAADSAFSVTAGSRAVFYALGRDGAGANANVARWFAILSA